MNSNVFYKPTVYDIIGQYISASIIALALHWCKLYFIGQWTALTFSIIQGCRLLLVIAISWTLLGQQITLKGFIGYVICIFGVVLYNWIKYRDKHNNTFKQIKPDITSINTH